MYSIPKRIIFLSLFLAFFTPQAHAMAMVPAYIKISEELTVARKVAQTDLIQRLTDELDIARREQNRHAHFAAALRARTPIDEYREANNPIAALLNPLMNLTQLPKIASYMSEFSHSIALGSLERQLETAMREYETLNSAVHITQLPVTQQTGNACGFHAATNSKSIDLLMRENAEINAEAVCVYSSMLRVSECPDDIMRVDNEILDYATRNVRGFSGYAGLDLDNVYTLGKVDGTENFFAITGSHENGIIKDERYDMTLVSEAYNFDIHAIPTDIMRDIFNLERPIGNLRNQVERNGRGAVHFIIGMPGHYVQASVVHYAEHTPHIFYSDSLNTSLESRYNALEIVQYIKREFEKSLPH